MTTENPYPWADGMDCAVTVCDTGGTILYMNDKARTTFARHGDMVGKNLFDCHGERSREIIRRLLTDGGTNVYTIEKNGVRKMIYQTAWRVDGVVGTGRNLDGDSCRDAAPHPQLIPERRSTRGAGVPPSRITTPGLPFSDYDSRTTPPGIMNSGYSFHPIPDSRGSGCACPGIRDTSGAALRNSAPVNHTAEQNF